MTNELDDQLRAIPQPPGFDAAVIPASAPSSGPLPGEAPGGTGAETESAIAPGRPTGTQTGPHPANTTAGRLVGGTIDPDADAASGPAPFADGSMPNKPFPVDEALLRRVDRAIAASGFFDDAPAWQDEPGTAHDPAFISPDSSVSASASASASAEQRARRRQRPDRNRPNRGKHRFRHRHDPPEGPNRVRPSRIWRVLAVGVGAVLLVAAGLAAWRSSGGPAAPELPGTATATLLIHTDGRTNSLALFTTDGAGRGAVVSVPRTLVVAAPVGGQLTTLGNVTDPADIVERVGSVLGIRINNHIVASSADLRALIDRIGDLEVDTDRAFDATGTVSGTPAAMSLPAGPHFFDGTQTVAFMNATGTGSEAERDARLVAVWRGLVRRIGTDPAKLSAAFAAQPFTGGSAEAGTLTGGLLARLARSGDNIAYQVIAVTPALDSAGRPAAQPVPAPLAALRDLLPAGLRR